MKIKEGQVLHDMHDGITKSSSGRIRTRDGVELRVIRDSFHSLPMRGSNAAVLAMLAEIGVYRYTNKYLVALNSSDCDCDITAVWSYDDRRLGVMTLEIVD